MRFAILGLYNSGSSALAGMLHRLGANLGPPFWGDDPPGTGTLHEADDLARELRRWWAEPLLQAQVTPAERVAYLAAWMARHEASGTAPCGAKHPLLSLCGPDLLSAWGGDTLFIWSWRPLPESIAGLTRRRWFEGREVAVQEQVWRAIEDFAASGVPVVRVEWMAVRRDPDGAARRLADLVGLTPSDGQLAAAAAWVRP
jgi:hypothetical protein